MVLSTILIVLGAFELAHPFEGEWLLAAAAGWLTTPARCVALARRSDLQGLPRLSGLPSSMSEVVYKATIAWLHVGQPLARMRGRLKGMWSLPRTLRSDGSAQPWQASVPSLGDARQSVRLMAGLVDRRAFWSESWFTHTSTLSELAAVLRASRPAQVVELDDGWHADRDSSLAVGHWGWLDLRVLVEEHAEGRCLVRGAPGFVQAGKSRRWFDLIAMASLGALATIDWPVAARHSSRLLERSSRVAWRTGRAASVGGARSHASAEPQGFFRFQFGPLVAPVPLRVC